MRLEDKLKLKESKIIDVAANYDFIKSTPFMDECYSNFDRALHGMVSDHLFLIGIDPGVGKSTGVQRYIKSLISGSRSVPDSGVIIILSRLDEILAYTNACGLSDADYAVIVGGDVKMTGRKYGGRFDVDNAPILFTTSQKLAADVGHSFNDLTRYHYKGKPRALRIWDEEFCPAASVTIRIDALTALNLPLRVPANGLVTTIEAIEKEAREGVKPLIPVPYSVALQAQAARSDVVALTETEKATLHDFETLAGQEVRLVRSNHGVRSLVGERRRFPADLYPLFVLDASSRIAAFYGIMEAGGVPIERLAITPPDYSNARFHHMRAGAGKLTLSKAPGQERAIYEAAAVMNASSDAEWLILYNQVAGFNIKKRLRDACPGKLLNFVHWGDHRASNKFRLVRQVMCIGLQRYDDAGYEARHIESLGEYSRRSVDVQTLRTSELQSLMLQGLARCNMRNHREGKCGECNIYIIDSEPNLSDLIAKTFPGSSCGKWTAAKIDLSGKLRLIFDHVLSYSPAELTDGVKRADVYRALGIDKSNFSNYMKDIRLRGALAYEGISIESRAFRAS